MKRLLRRLPFGLAARPRAKASLIVVGGNLVGAGAAFVAAIVAARVLSLDQFATFGVGLAVNSLAVQFGDFGLGTIAIAETANSTDGIVARQKLRSLALHRARTALLVGALVTAVVLVLPFLAPYRATATVGAAGEVFGSLALFFIWSLQGERSFVAAASLQGLQGLLRLVFVGGCAIAGLGSVAMLVGYALLAPAIVAIAGGLLLFARPPRPLVESAGSPGSASTEVDIGRRRVMAFTGVFAALVINGDVLLLTVLAGQHDVAAYTAAWRFSAGMFLVNTAIASAFLPFIVTAPDAWVEAKHLVRWGLMVAAGWLLLMPLMIFVGPLLLGSIGDAARGPLTILLIAFAIEGFYFVVYQIYLRVRREKLLLVAAATEFATMATVTVLLRDKGALAPAYGQLVARIVVCGLMIAPIVLAAIGRCDWFRESDRSSQPVAPEPPQLTL
jgi:O-antigen/teichoic acid export membrane protein